MSHPVFSEPPVFALTRPPPRRASLHAASMAVVLLGAAAVCLAAAATPHLDVPPSAGVATSKRTSDGALVRWSRDAIVLSVAPSMSGVVSDGPRVVAAALAAWTGAHPNLPALSVDADAAGDEPAEGPPAGANVVRLLPEDVTLPEHALAVTALTFESASGVIVGAQILVDARNHTFAELTGDDEASSAYDLQSVITHEIGHVLGLGEDYDDSRATMFLSATRGDTRKRVFTSADREALAPLYGGARGGDDARGKGCALGPVSPGGAGWLFVLATLACVALRRRTLGALAALVVLATLPSTSAAGLDHVEIVDARSRWQGGLVLTTLRVRDAAGRDLPDVTVLGGTVGAHTQLAAGVLPPRPGTRVARTSLGRSAIRQGAQ